MVKWTSAEENFLRDNWANMNVHEVTAALNEKFNTNRTEGSIDNKIDRMKLPKKSEYYRLGAINDETKLELEGRKRTEQLKKIANMIDLYKEVKIKVVSDKQGQTPTRFINGTVVEKNKKFITLQADNYKESFLYTDFYTRRAVII